jgi:hypothetical protein
VGGSYSSRALAFAGLESPAHNSRPRRRKTDGPASRGKVSKHWKAEQVFFPSLGKSRLPRACRRAEFFPRLGTFRRTFSEPALENRRGKATTEHKKHKETFAVSALLIVKNLFSCEENPKHEYRNPKQIQNLQKENPQRLGRVFRRFQLWDLRFVSGFGFRICLRPQAAVCSFAANFSPADR